jgi:hypothetical protein
MVSLALLVHMMTANIECLRCRAKMEEGLVTDQG